MIDKSEGFNDGCASITKQSAVTADKCTAKQMDEQTDGWWLRASSGMAEMPVSTKVARDLHV